MPGSTVLMKPNSSGKTLFADVILRAVGKAFRDDLKASSRRRQTENRSFANAGRCSASVLSSSNSRSTFRNSLPSGILWVNALPLDVTSKQRISLVTELLPRPAVGQETGCHPCSTLPSQIVTHLVLNARNAG